VIAAILDLVPNIGATLAGAIIALLSLSVSLEAMIAFLVVIVVYQQVENYILQPTIIGKAAKIFGFTVLASVLAFRSSGWSARSSVSRSRPACRSSSRS
jgi:predicted PurR-regulated permease PerM